jgi:hypothetical protein
MSETGMDYLPSDARTWVEENRALLGLVVAHLRRDAEWPRRAELQRELLARGEPLALRPIFAEMPRLLGFVRDPEDRIVLTLFGLAETDAGLPLVEAFVQCLRVAAARYRDEASPELRRADVDALPLEPAERLVLGEILLREAPFLGSGAGAHDEDWEREVTEDIVRYWEDLTAGDYLRRRGSELRSNPLFGLEPALAGDERGETTGPSTPRGGGDAAPADAVPPWATIFVSIIVALPAVFSLVFSFPRPLVVASLLSAASAAVIWRRGFHWPPGRTRLVLVVLAGCLGAAGTFAVERGWPQSGAGPPEHSQAVVSGYVSFTRRRAMDWLQDPTIHQASVEYFKTHFSALDPERPHKFSIVQANVVVDVPTLVQRAPELSGLLLRVRGKLIHSSAVAAYRKATSWALILRDARLPRAIAVCRVPLARGEEDAYQPGDTIHATGVLLADGGVPRADGIGSLRVAYLACASVAKTVARIDIVVPRRRTR